MKRVLPLLALLALMTAVSLAQTPTPPPPGRGPGQGGPPPPFPGDTMATERDSLMRVVMKQIAGKEQVAAESVFKDIQLLKGRPAGSIPQVMNHGFGRALAVSCFHCHSKDGWDKDHEKKKIAREMMKMANGINTEYLAKIEGLGGGRTGPDGQPLKPTVNCSTCHRGSTRTQGIPGQRPPGGQR